MQNKLIFISVKGKIESFELIIKVTIEFYLLVFVELFLN